MRRFEPARPRHFVTAKDLRIRHHHQFEGFGNEAARQRAEVQDRAWISFAFRFGFRKPILRPNLLKALPLALIVAKDMDGVPFSQPEIEQAKEFAALRLGDLRIW